MFSWQETFGQLECDSNKGSRIAERTIYSSDDVIHLFHGPNPDMHAL